MSYDPAVSEFGLGRFMSESFTIEHAAKVQEACHQEFFMESLGGQPFDEVKLPLTWLRKAAKECFQSMESRSLEESKPSHFTASVLLDLSLVVALHYSLKSKSEGENVQRPMSLLRFLAGAVSWLSKASLPLKLLFRTSPSLKQAVDQMTSVAKGAMTLQAEKDLLVTLHTQLESLRDAFKSGKLDNTDLINNLDKYRQTLQDKSEEDFKQELELVQKVTADLSQLSQDTCQKEGATVTSWMDDYVTESSANSSVKILPTIKDYDRVAFTTIAFTCKVEAALGPQELQGALNISAAILESLRLCCHTRREEEDQAYPQQPNLEAMQTHQEIVNKYVTFQDLAQALTTCKVQSPLLPFLASLKQFLTEHKEAVFFTMRQIAKDEFNAEHTVKTFEDSKLAEAMPELFHVGFLVKRFHTQEDLPAKVAEETVLQDMSVFLQWQELLEPALKYTSQSVVLDVFQEDYPAVHLTYTTAVDGYQDALTTYTNAFLKQYQILADQIAGNKAIETAMSTWNFDSVQDVFSDEKELTKSTKQLQEQIDLVCNQQKVVKELGAKAITFPDAIKNILAKLPNETSLKARQPNMK